MALSLVFTIAACCMVTIAIRRKFSSRQNCKIARRSGFPVIMSPVDIAEFWWLMLYPLLVPLFSLLPRTLTPSWLPFMQRFHLWKLGHQSFETIGSDTVILASPRGNLLQTCDPVVAHQILSQHTKIKMNLEATKIFDIWGPTVGSTEGKMWRAHRKIVTAGLSRQINQHVWDEAVENTDKLLNQWEQRYNFAVDRVKPWTSKLALHVIAATFFERELPWKEQKQEHGEHSGGHRLTFEQALMTIVSEIRVIFMLPKPVLDRLPMKFARDARLAMGEWTTYMREMCQGILARADETSNKFGKSLLEHIVVGFKDLDNHEKEQLPREYALGNIFFTLLAGHETIGNTLAFVLLLLCVHPEWQTRIQQQIDSQPVAVAAAETEAKDEKRRHWSYHDQYARLQKGPLAAVINETLRVYNPVQMVWRTVTTPTSVTDSQDVVHELEAGTLCMINFSAAHRNPRWWPSLRENISSVRRVELHHSPAIDFDPNRWLDEDDNVGFMTPKNETDKKMPTCWPFSQGVRSCPGRDFAMVEMTAVVSTLLRHYSFRLKLAPNQSWSAARDDALRKLVDGIRVKLNIEMVQDLPICVIPRACRRQS